MTMRGPSIRWSVLLACLLSAVLLAVSADAAAARIAPRPGGEPVAGAVVTAEELPSECGPGHAWLAGSQGGVSCLDADGWSLYDGGWGEFPGGSVSDAAVCRDGTTWLATTSALISTAGSTWQTHSGMPSTLDAIACDSKQGVWAAGYKGAYYYDGSKLTTYPSSKLGTGKSVDLVHDVAVGPDGHVWVVTSNSVATYDGKRWTYFQKGRGFAKEYFFEAVAVDVRGRVWAAHMNGVLMYNGSRWTAYDKSFLSQSQVLATDAKGRVWVGTYSHGVSVFSGTAWKTYDRTNSKLPSDQIESLAVDAAGRVWIGTEWGLAVLAGSTWTVFHMSDSTIPDDEISAIAVAGKGPVLPARVSKQPGSVTGVIVKAGAAQSAVPVEICVGYLGMFYWGTTPCSGQPFHLSAKTGANGRFTFAKVPVGWYSITFRPPGGKWTTLSSSLGIGSSQKLVSEGEETDLGTIDLAEGD